MRSVNKVILIGNLTRNPVLKQTQNGQTIVGFGIATNRAWMTAHGEKKESAEFHEVVAWSKLGEICHKYLNKGKLVYVEGYLKTRSWEMENGEKKFRTEIVLQDMIMLDKKSGEYSDDMPVAINNSNDSSESMISDDDMQIEDSGNIF